MPSKCFDPLRIIFKEEPHQSVIFTTRIEIKLIYEYMMCLDILKSIVETENMKNTPNEVDLTHSGTCTVSENYRVKSAILQY
jgi:hypothetical protein